MKRRKFLQIGGGAGLAFLINGLPISTFAGSPVLEQLAKQTALNGRVLVLIQLNGGNDGLNTVIPLDRYSELAAARSNILINQSAVLPLTGQTTTGLHPAMSALRSMYNDGLVNIVQGAGYPDPNFSHFRATDIWTSASDSTVVVPTGWLGRHLNKAYAGYPTGYPKPSMPDPLAIQIGTGVSPVLQGPQLNMGMAISDVSSFYNIVSGTVDPAPATPAGHELTFIRYVAQQTQSYTGVIQTAANAAQNIAIYPATNSLAQQLKIVARLIAGGLQTPVYVVSTGGFDTHAMQADAADHSVGTHANLLKNLSEAVSVFFDDLRQLNARDRVAAMTFSEFGRRIKSNASGGTDHGTTAPVFVFGTGVNPGIIGTSPVLPASAGVNDNLPLQTDFRSIYAAVLADWFGLDAATTNSLLLKPFPISPVFRKSASVKQTENATTGNEALSMPYPNPARETVTVNLDLAGGYTNLSLFDVSGRIVREVVSGSMPRGTHQVTLERDGLPSGNYFLRLTTATEKGTRQVVFVD